MSSMTTQPSIADADDAIRQRQKGAALAVAMLGFAVVALDAQITNVALPTIRERAEVWCSDSRIDHERHRVSTR